MRQVFVKPSGVQTGFIHSDQTDRGEMIVKAFAQIASRIRIETHVHIFVDDLSLNVQ